MRGTPAERFWNKVDLPNEAGCMLWTGATQPNGYGTFGVGKGRTVRAHRFSYDLAFGRVPDGLEVDHLCAVRNCVSPAHLEAVTRQENVARSSVAAVQKARHARRTHCKRGHAFDDANTYVTRSGARSCRTCQNAHSNAYKERKRACSPTPSA